MCIVNYNVGIDVATFVGFVLREIMDNGGNQFITINSKGNKSLKLLSMIWILACFVLVRSYYGNLTAMLTRPSMEKSINSIEDLLNQTYFKWILNPGGNELNSYLKASDTLQPLYEMAEQKPEWDKWAPPYQCFSREELEVGSYVSICYDVQIRFDKSWDFKETGRCNFYTIDETFLTNPNVMAFQVQCSQS